MLRLTVTAVLVSVCFFVVGCTKTSAPSVPSTPNGTVETVAKSLADKQPGVLWNAMPSSYQSDVNGLIQTFANKVDKEVYDKSFAVVGKLIEVLSEKRDFILGHPMLQSGMVKVDDLKEHWDSVVNLLQTLADSDIKSIESLKTLDVGEFLSSTGAKLMQEAADISKTAARDEMGANLHRMANIKVEVVSSEGDSAKLKISAPDAPTQEVDLMKIDGKWVPKEMADDWQSAMQKARASLDGFNMGENKGQAMMMLGGLDDALDGLLAAKTQDEFNQTAMQAMGQIMSAGAGQPPPPPQFPR